MRNASLLSAAAAGALSLYFLDPQQGRSRRARVRDKVIGKLSRADEAGATVAVDVRNRLKGLFARLRTRVTSKDVADPILVERVRTKLGRFLSHPGAVEVTASDGSITLRGPVLKHEADRVLRAVHQVPGVRNVVDAFERHKEPGNVSSLQGGRPRMQRADILQEHWAPATRLLMGGGGAVLAVRGLLRRSPFALLLAAAGTAAAVRAVTNMDARRLLGQRGRRGLDVTKTITIAAPVEEVFRFWSRFENFPSFMRHVRVVRRNADNESWHWEVTGPFGRTVHWDARVTRFIPNEVIAWSTNPGSPVQHSGFVSFQPKGASTRVQVEMTYNPPGGALGHAVAWLIAADPHTEMDDDLMRLKAYLETGKFAHDAAQAPVREP